MQDLHQPPYPRDVRAKGWRFELDPDQVERSDTWALASPVARPWLLMMWLQAWRESPCGSLPADREVLAAKLGMPADLWAQHERVLLRGWRECSDGRLYHDTLTARVIEMLEKRRSDSDRQAARRAREAMESRATHAVVTRDTHVNHDGVGVESNTDNGPLITEQPLKSNTEVQTNTPRGKRARAAARLVSVEALTAEGVDAQHAEDWLLVRKGKGMPLTPTAWKQVKAEADKAGLTPAQAVERSATDGWAGFKASWLTGPPAEGARILPIAGKQAAIEQHNRAVGEAWLAKQGVA